jgi:diaminohydroxyphosphoribosylaminopyrimidine deaminase/5-amino-6-(5-phosphoribosylamino)uracil reductase
MQRCLDLAEAGAGQVPPNPMVGAVLVCDDTIIGEGYHLQYGGSHAEVNCINSVSPANASLISKSTLYVSLEPCVHFGKTPPCTDLIIANKIREVVVGCKDPYNKVNGKGIEKLKTAGVHVITGVMETAAMTINKRFFTFHRLHRPYIILKWAQSNDGKIGFPSIPIAIGTPKGKASEDSKTSKLLISNEFTNRLVHKWRSEEAAIMVGTNTALQDNPALTVRLWPGNDPLRLVIDMDLKLPLSLQLFDGTVQTIVFNQQKQQEGIVSYYKINKNGKMLQQILDALYKLEIQSIIVEGGAKLLQSFIDENLWDEARVITNQQLTIGNGKDAPVLLKNTLGHTQHVQTDLINTYFPTL